MMEREVMTYSVASGPGQRKPIAKEAVKQQASCRHPLSGVMAASFHGRKRTYAVKAAQAGQGESSRRASRTGCSQKSSAGDDCDARQDAGKGAAFYPLQVSNAGTLSAKVAHDRRLIKLTGSETKDQ
jgi:hypothetical protein